MAAMSGWKSLIRYDPIPPLIGSDNPAIIYATRRDLLDSNLRATLLKCSGTLVGAQDDDAELRDFRETHFEIMPFDLEVLE